MRFHTPQVLQCLRRLLRRSGGPATGGIWPSLASWATLRALRRPRRALWRLGGPPWWDLAQPGELGPPLPNWDGGRRTLVALLALLKRMALGKCSPRARSRFPHRNSNRSPGPSVKGSGLSFAMNNKAFPLAEPRPNTLFLARRRTIYASRKPGHAAACRLLQHGELCFRYSGSTCRCSACVNAALGLPKHTREAGH